MIWRIIAEEEQEYHPIFLVILHAIFRSVSCTGTAVDINDTIVIVPKER